MLWIAHKREYISTALVIVSQEYSPDFIYKSQGQNVICFKIEIFQIWFSFIYVAGSLLE